MTNECVMHTVEPGLRPAQLIRLVNTAQVNLTTKTPSLLLLLLLLHSSASPLLLYRRKEAGSCLDLAPRRRVGESEGMKGRVATGDGELWEEEMA